MWRPLRTARQHRLLVAAAGLALVLVLAIVVSVLLTFGGSGESNGQVEELPSPPVHHPPPPAHPGVASFSTNRLA